MRTYFDKIFNYLFLYVREESSIMNTLQILFSTR